MKLASFLTLLILLTLGMVSSTEQAILTEIYVKLFSQTLLGEWKNNQQAFKDSFMEAFKIHRENENKKLDDSLAISLEDLHAFAYFFVGSLARKFNVINEFLLNSTAALGITISNFTDQALLQETSGLEAVIDELLKLKDLCQYSLKAAGIDITDEPVILSSKNIGDFTLKVIGGTSNPRVTILVLGENRIADFSPLASFHNLKMLILSGNRISEIPKLPSLSRLECLDLTNNQISDISNLASLSDVHILRLGHNLITDISQLSLLSSLKELLLENNRISDISKLQSLTNIKYLRVNKNQIVDISALAYLKVLETLDLSGNQVSNFEILGSLPRLRQVKTDRDIQKEGSKQ